MQNLNNPTKPTQSTYKTFWVHVPLHTQLLYFVSEKY